MLFYRQYISSRYLINSMIKKLNLYIYAKPIKHRNTDQHNVGRLLFRTRQSAYFIGYLNILMRITLRDAFFVWLLKSIRNRAPVPARARSTTAAGGGYRECELAQRSKLTATSRSARQFWAPQEGDKDKFSPKQNNQERLELHSAKPNTIG